MINKELLYKIWNENKYKYFSFRNRIIISNLNKTIYICDDDFFKIKEISTLSNIKICKNCLISKPIFYTTKIYIHQNYILSILRNKTINNILND